MLPLFDMHCDTLSSAFENGYSLFSSPLQASFDKSQGFSPYIQVMAIWTNKNLSNSDGYKRYLHIYEYAKAQGLKLASSKDDLSSSSLILSIEDARIIENDLSRLDDFYSDGVRIITPMWKGVNIIGGAWDTDTGLSLFGKNAISKMLNLGITIDLSHASERAFYEILLLSADMGRIPVASHSNSHFACKHKRNLSRVQARDLIKMKSIIGISLAPEHLSMSKEATINDILRHIDDYLSLGAEDNLCLGCDFDGVDSLPQEINDIADLEKLYFAIEAHFGKEVSDKIFFKNAYSFTIKNILI